MIAIHAKLEYYSDKSSKNKKKMNQFEKPKKNLSKEIENEK